MLFNVKEEMENPYEWQRSSMALQDTMAARPSSAPADVDLLQCNDVRPERADDRGEALEVSGAVWIPPAEHVVREHADASGHGEHGVRLHRGLRGTRGWDYWCRVVPMKPIGEQRFGQS